MYFLTHFLYLSLVFSLPHIQWPEYICAFTHILSLPFWKNLAQPIYWSKTHNPVKSFNTKRSTAVILKISVLIGVTKRFQIILDLLHKISFHPTTVSYRHPATIYYIFMLFSTIKHQNPFICLGVMLEQEFVYFYPQLLW